MDQQLAEQRATVWVRRLAVGAERTVALADETTREAQAEPRQSYPKAVRTRLVVKPQVAATISEERARPHPGAAEPPAMAARATSKRAVALALVA